LDRGSTFADDRIIKRLQADFIPVTGNTHDLQNQRWKASEWFMSLARVANPRVNEGQTSQGFYIAGPDAATYGFNNNRDPERVLAFIDQGLKAHREKPPTKVQVTEDEIAAAFFRKPPEPATTVRVFSRIRPLPADADRLNHTVGRDHMWIYKSDVQQIIGKTGRFPMPERLQNRIVRYHLVDNVRGEPDFWKAEEVREANFQMWPKGGGSYAFAGTYAMATPNNTRGLAGKLEGELKVDAATMLVTNFKAFGESSAWGAGTYTPRPPEGRFPVLFAFVDVDDQYSRVTPPQAALYGGPY
jgi:hypothetical protein